MLFVVHERIDLPLAAGSTNRVFEGRPSVFQAPTQTSARIYQVVARAAGLFRRASRFSDRPRIGKSRGRSAPVLTFFPILRGPRERDRGPGRN